MKDPPLRSGALEDLGEGLHAVLDAQCLLVEGHGRLAAQVRCVLGGASCPFQAVVARLEGLDGDRDGLARRGPKSTI